MKLFKKRILIIGIRVLIYLHLSHKKLRDLYFYYKNLMCNGFYSNKLIYLFLRKRNNFVGFITPVVKKMAHSHEKPRGCSRYSRPPSVL